MKKLELRDYQEKIVNDLKHFPASALFMGTGTGKTFTSLELNRNFETDNLLVITPKNAIKQWETVISRHYPRYNVLEIKKSWSSNKINDFLKTYDFSNPTAFVINFDMVFRLKELLKIVNNRWTIIVDEMHRIRNYGLLTKPNITTSFVLKLGELTEYKIGLTATPTQGNYGGYLEYYTQLKFLGYIDMTYKEYYETYVLYRNKSVGGLPFPIKEIIGYRATKDIDALLSIIARSYKSKNGDYEPQHIEIVVDKSKNYNRTLRDKVYKDIVINNASRARIAKKTLTTGSIHGNNLSGDVIRYIDNYSKINWLKEFLEDVDSRVVVMYNYNVELDTLIGLAKMLDIPYGVINGSVSDKNAVVEQEWKVLFGQYAAMSEALDGLQFVSHIMVLFALPESSILYRQVLGRIDRIGQVNVPTYYYLIMEGTIDEQIQKSINDKVEFSEKTLNMLEV